MVRSAKQEYQRRLELIVQNTTNMVVVTNRDREVEWVNPAYTAVTGWTLDEVKGKTPRTFLHGPQTNWSAASRLGALLRKGQAVTEFEILNYKKSGEAFWVCLNIQPILDEKGEVTEYISIQSDITERKQRELEAAHLHRQLVHAQHLAKLGSIEHSIGTGEVHCSPEVCQILDAVQGEVDTRYENLLAHVHPEDEPEVKRQYEHAINTGGSYIAEFRVLSRTGRVKWVHVHGILEGWEDGTPALCRLAVQDITERKQSEQVARDKELLEQALKTQMEVLSRVSHELRTPLHAVLGFAEIVERLEAARMSERCKGHMQQIHESARHLLLVVNDILDLTRLHGGRVAFDMQAVDLYEAARQVVALLGPMAAGRGLTLEVEAPGAAPFALADRQRLIQVLINLIGNAIKYNRPKGSVTVRFETPGEREVAVAVQDDGIGIAAEHLGRLFEPFYRAAAARGGSLAPVAQPQVQDSSGLGLAISKSLAQGMGGDIAVQSQAGVGSTFRLTLQRAAQSAAAPERTLTLVASARDNAAPGTAGSVLYIEDNEVNCLLVQAYLQARPGVTLVCCSTGASGLATARRTRPTLILVDMHLPDMTGHDVMRMLLDDPDLYRTPCVAFSADGDDHAVAAAIRSGFREFMQKPIAAAEFLQVIDRLASEEALVTRF